MSETSKKADQESLPRTPSPRVPLLNGATRGASGPGRTFALRAAVAAAWAIVVGALMAAGAYWTNMPEWQIPAVGVLGGLGAAVYVLYFA